MKRLFVAVFVALAALSVVAVRLQPAADGKLVWVSDDNPRRKEQIALFNRELASGALDGPETTSHVGVKLDPNNGGMEKVIVQSIGGVGPDLFDCYSANSLAAFVRSGVALDLTEALRKRGVDMGSVWPAAKPECVLDGRVYGFPTNAAVDALWLNKDLFERAGVPLPKRRAWTWDEFLPLAQRLTIGDASGRITRYGFLADWYALWPLCLMQWGGHIYTPDGKRCVIDSPQAIAGVQFAHDLIYKYHVMPSPFEEAALSGQGGWGNGTIKWLGAGKGATALGGRWWLCTLRDQTHPMHDGRPLPPTLRLSAVECPHGPLRVFRGYGRATLINAASPHAAEALDFLVFESRKPYNDLINAQADGVGPVIADCDTPEFLHDPRYPEEDYNEVWRDEMRAAAPEDQSSFVDGQAVQRIIEVQLDLVKSDQKPVAEALYDAARQINAEIARMVAADPSLARRYRNER